MTQLLKRIIIAQSPNIIIKDIGTGIYLRRVGDSRELLSQFTLEEVCASESLDSLVASGHVKLLDENGNELTSTTQKKATNLATLKDVDSAQSSQGYKNYTFDADGSSSYSIRASNISNNATLTFESGTTLIYINGILIEQDVDYEEESNLYEFSFINVGSTGLPTLPTANDVITIVFK